MMGRRMRLLHLPMVLLALAASARGAAAQNPTPADTTARADTLGPRAPQEIEAPNPRSALIKSMIIPGWGQVSVGSPGRGIVYFAIGATSWGMLGKTIHKLNEAKDRAGARETAVVDSLRAAMAADSLLAEELADSAVFTARVDADSLLSDNRGLVRARRQQRQDWIAYTLFFTFLNAIDAYVAAHLKDFPGELEVERRADGSASLGYRVPIGRPRE